MIELAYDIAPGASYKFYTAYLGEDVSVQHGVLPREEFSRHGRLSTRLLSAGTIPDSGLPIIHPCCLRRHSVLSISEHAAKRRLDEGNARFWTTYRC